MILIPETLRELKVYFDGAGKTCIFFGVGGTYLVKAKMNITLLGCYSFGQRL